MSTTFVIPSTVSSWTNFYLIIINSLDISCLNLGLNKILINLREWSRKLSILHARLRHQCSSLNSDLFRINIIYDSKWQCGSPFGDSIHYIMECPLHQKNINHGSSALQISCRNVVRVNSSF